MTTASSLWATLIDGDVLIGSVFADDERSRSQNPVRYVYDK
ncbi:hypothetical protein [Nocardia flavorosea]|nr:hypothetical protein [Nocardia flavorosea]